MDYMHGAQFIVLAHRGGPGDGFAENSLDAFKHAAKLGCTYLETDVRLATDGRLYLAHDGTSWLPNRLLKPDPSLATLESLFKRFPKAYFSIDPKHPRVVQPLAELIVKAGMANQVCIGSSFDGRAQKVADLVEEKMGVRPATAFVSATASLNVLLGAGRFANVRQDKRPAFIHIHRSLITESVVRRVHAQGLKLIAWVVNDKPTMLRMKQWGVDGFMTDCPEVAKEAGLL